MHANRSILLQATESKFLRTIHDHDVLVLPDKRFLFPVPLVSLVALLSMELNETIRKSVIVCIFSFHEFRSGTAIQILTLASMHRESLHAGCAHSPNLIVKRSLFFADPGYQERYDR